MFSSYSFQAARRWTAVFAILACLSIGFLGFATPTTTTVVVKTGSSAPSVYGEQVTFEVTLTGVQTPSGTVTLKEGSITLGGPTSLPDTPYQVNFDLSTLSVGSHTINAEYVDSDPGGNDYDDSSGSLFHTVDKDGTTTAVSSNKASPVTGEDITFTATVTADTSSEIPTGGVTFYADGNVIGSGLPLNGSGVATCTAAFNAADSTVAITASYGGDGNYNTSSGALDPAQTIELATTTTTVASDKASPVTGESVTFTATVAAAGNGSGTPTGHATFVFSPAAVGSQKIALNNGQAEYTTSMLKASVDPYSVTATYNPPTTDPNYITSADALDPTQTVDKADTVIVITGDDPDPSIEGEAYTVTWSVSVSAPGSDTPGTPTGDVTAGDGDGNTCVEAWETDDNCDITSDSDGAKILTATYAGDGDYNTSDTTASHTVNTADTSVVVTSSANPSDIGDSVTFTATVTADSPGAATPAGTVTFSYSVSGADSWTAMCSTVALSSGTADCIYDSLAAGDWDIKAEYTATGGSLFDVKSGVDSTSDSYLQRVNKLDLTLTIDSDVNDPSEVGEAYTVTWSVTLPSGGPSATGDVTVSDGTSSCTGSCTTGVSVGTGTCSLTSATAGLRTLTATYAGNDTYNPATDTVSHQVDQGDVSITIEPDSTHTSEWTSGETGDFTATVEAAGNAAGTPTGTVTFVIKDQATATIKTSGPHTLDGSGEATSDSVTLTDSQSTVTVTVTYSGDSAFNSASNTADQVVTAATLTGFVISSDTPDPSTVTEDITVNWRADDAFADSSTVTVTLYDENGVTTGVTCQQTYGTDNTLSTGSCILLAGGAMPDGNMTLVAEYSVGPVSTSLEPHTVIAYTTATTVALSPNTVYVNEPTTITATVQADSAGPGLSGRTVNFTTTALPSGADGDFSPDYCTLLGRVLVDLSTEASSCSTATYTPTAAGANTDTITIQAEFPTDAPYLTSSNTSNLTVNKREPDVNVTCAPDSVYINQETTCTVTVEDATGAGNSTTPSGTVTASDGGMAGTFSPSDTGSLSYGSHDVTYTPGPGDEGTTTITAVYSGSDVYLEDATGDTDTIAVALRPTETTISWKNSVSGTDPLFVDEQGTITVTVTDVASDGDPVAPSGTVNVTAASGTISGCSSLTAISTSESQSTCTYVLTSSSEVHFWDTVTAAYDAGSPQVHDDSSESTDVPVMKRSTETTLSCDDSSPTNCTATVEDVSARGTKSAPAGDIMKYEDQSTMDKYCDLASPAAPSNSCTFTVTGTDPFEIVNVKYEPDDDKHIDSFAMDMIERGLPSGTGTCSDIDIEALIFAGNTTCTVLQALAIAANSGAAAASVLPDPVWTAIFAGTTAPVGDMIAAALSGIALHLDIAIATVCTDLDGDGIPGSIEALTAGLDDAKWDSDGDGLGDLEEIDLAKGKLSTSFSVGDSSATGCACPNPTVADSDGDGLLDGVEGGFYPTSICDPDTDDDTLTDKQEVDTWTLSDIRDHADPLMADTDGDGLRDDKEFYSNSCPFINDDDSDDDGLQDGAEDWNADGIITTGTIGDTGTRGPASNPGVAGETDFCNPDTDGDGLTDGEEFALFGGLQPDPDVGQGFIDVSVSSLTVTVSATIPALDMDSDDDGLSDYEEVHVTQTDPLDWDTDDDTISDSNELIATGGAWPQRAFKQVSDPLDPDTDDDGLLDNIEYSGTALGTSHGIGGTDDLVCPFVNDDDSDDDGLQDGTEAWSGDASITTGAIGDSTTQAKISPTTGETDFCDPDTDNDGLTDGEEVALLGGLPVSSSTGFTTVTPQGVSTTFGVDGPDLTDTVPPLDDDCDNDGLSDYEEVNITHTDPLDADSDNDTLSDANELIATGGTWPNRTFIQVSDPLDPDTDDDDLHDQIEYPGSGLGLSRSEGGLPDNACPYVNDDDSDDDGLQDGVEDANHDGTWGDSSVGGGITVGSFDTQSEKVAAVGPWECDLCNPDTDGDGLLDGEEVGLIGGGPTGAGTTRPTTGFDEVAPDKVSEVLPMGDVTSLAGTPPGTGNLFLGPYTFSPVPNGTIAETVPALDMDSDNDGLSDYEEVNITGTDPLDQDTDNDTLMDADELIATGGSWPNRTFDQESDPLDINTDDDHLFDPQEYYNAGKYGSGLGSSPLLGGLGGARDICPFVNDDDSDDDGIQDGKVITVSPPGVITSTGDPYTYTHYEDFVDVIDADQDQPVVVRTVATPGNGEQNEATVVQNVCDADSDGDGLLDGEEVAIGTNPDDYDTDDDGRNDWHEVTGGGPIPTDPFDPDTDDDGVLDSAEVAGQNPTNPVNADTDGDGLCDGGTGTPWMASGDSRIVINPICKSCNDPATDANLDPCGTSIRTGSVDGIGDHPNPHGYGEDKDGDGTWDFGTDYWGNTGPGGDETDPNQYDTDGDAEGDGIEVLGFSTSRQSWIPTTDLFGRTINVEYPDCGCLNPLDPDTDGDGLSDGYEDNNHDGNFDFLPSDFDYEQVPLPGPPQPNPNETNPCNPDTDDDDLTDYEERYQAQVFELYANWDNDGDGLYNEDPVDGIDNDGDGLVDEDPVEPPYNPTNPLDHDTDNDWLFDGFEVKYLCVEIACSQLDNDTDGAINEDPIDGIDNDGDGLIDEDPVDFTIRFVPMLDPTNRDSDSDGYLDGLDDDPCNSECIPVVLPLEIVPVDTDGDGFSDEDEIFAGTHPNDPEDHPIAFYNVDMDFDQWIDDRVWLEPILGSEIANSVVIDIDNNVLIDFRLQIAHPRDVRTGDFDGDGDEDDIRYIVEYAFANYRVLQPRIVATIDDYNADLVIDWVIVERK